MIKRKFRVRKEAPPPPLFQDKIATGIINVQSLDEGEMVP